ncbi:DUF1501 domain-containing protein [Lapillicoccus jejuensis]|uniref:Uncharacterized protein (DUF1501 family) n=1 Tax=Lapillicoccus jejuensis TaxID=402171 RepID=A0A542E6Q3_9MICO|nr:DUF1501 domain-containing protein [Lapillicoccus jejuensis]TQJ11000.1 uncharacterized protein (DUF1501 family) [Lapillicoccus jejuensis]
MPLLPPLDPRRPLDGLTRRTLLRASCGVAAVGALAGAASVGWEQVAGRARRDPLPAGTPILVLVTMYGGNDGLGTVVPVGDPAYRDARPGLAWGADEVLPLDGPLAGPATGRDAVGLNPSLTGLADQWRAGRLAVVRGVGHPTLDRSHFRSIDVWQTASPDEPVGTGWVGRWLDTTGDDPLRALHLGSVLPPLAVGRRVLAAALPLGTAPSGGDRTVLDHFAAPDPGDSPVLAQVAASYGDAVRVGAALEPVGDRATGLLDADQSAATSFAAQVALTARCIRMGVPSRVYSLSLSGFDTHADERDGHAAQLARLDRGLTALRDALDGDPRAGDVVVMAYSEFGRRVRANASQGTDHGTSGPVLLLGDRVRGGLHGEQPSLTDLVDGDLRTTTDFRRVYGDVLRSVLHADPAQVLGQDPEPLGLLRPV